jgi:hypothetical protein
MKGSGVGALTGGGGGVRVDHATFRWLTHEGSMKTRSAVIVLAVLSFVLLPKPALVGADEPTKEEQRVHELIHKSLDNLLSGTLEEVEKRAKQAEKDGPLLLKDESKPDLGYHVYRERSQRSYYYHGKMVRLDVDGVKEVKDVLTKLSKPTTGPKFKWMQVPDAEARERCHWAFTIIVEQNDGKKVEQVPWTYVCEYTVHKDGAVTVSFIDTQAAETLDKALTKK